MIVIIDFFSFLPLNLINFLLATRDSYNVRYNTLHIWTARGPMYGVWEYIMKLVIGFLCYSVDVSVAIGRFKMCRKNIKQRGASNKKPAVLGCWLLMLKTCTLDVEMYFF